MASPSPAISSVVFLYAFLNHMFLLFLKTYVANLNLAVQGKGNIVFTKESLSREDKLNEFLVHCV